MSDFFPWREAPKADFAVIGDPVEHSLSPRMHNAAFRSLGMDLKYVAIHVPVGEVALALDRLTGLGYHGINATVPHKAEVLEWAEWIDPFAAKVQAANTLNLRERSCINTDAPGFLDTLRRLDISCRSMLVLGAGGSARALARACVDAGFSVYVYNRTVSKAEKLSEETGCHVRETPNVEGIDVVVNTTSASLMGETIPINWSKTGRDTVAYDLMYTRDSTPFLREAASNGQRTVDGRALLVAQGALSFEWWLGVEPPRDVMMEAIQSNG